MVHTGRLSARLSSQSLQTVCKQFANHLPSVVRRHERKAVDHVVAVAVTDAHNSVSDMGGAQRGGAAAARQSTAVPEQHTLSRGRDSELGGGARSVERGHLARSGAARLQLTTLTCAEPMASHTPAASIWSGSGVPALLRFLQPLRTPVTGYSHPRQDASATGSFGHSARKSTTRLCKRRWTGCVHSAPVAWQRRGRRAEVGEVREV